VGSNARSGVDGDVLIAATPNVVAEIDSWTLDESADVLDVTDYSSGGDSEMIPGTRTRTGSFEGNWYYGDSTGQLLLQAAFSGGTSVILRLQTQAGATTRGTAYIVGITKAAPVRDKIRATFKFQFTGAMTESYA